MSDVLSDTEMYSSEPDETVLTAALRNKDDIPILMDIVGEISAPVSQEEHLVHSFSHESLYAVEPQTDTEEFDEITADAGMSDVQDEADSAEQEVALELDQARLAAAIESVLQRKLPEIVQEVVLELSKNEKA